MMRECWVESRKGRVNAMGVGGGRANRTGQSKSYSCPLQDSHGEQKAVFGKDGGSWKRGEEKGGNKRRGR